MCACLGYHFLVFNLCALVGTTSSFAHFWKVSAGDVVVSYVRCQLLTRVAFVRNFQHSYLLWAQPRISPPCRSPVFFGSGVSGENLHLVHSVSECICTGSLTTIPKCTGSHFRPTESLRIPMSVLLPTTFGYALLQPTPLSSLNADFLSQLHLASE